MRVCFVPDDRQLPDQRWAAQDQTRPSRATCDAKDAKAGRFVVFYALKVYSFQLAPITITFSLECFIRTCIEKTCTVQWLQSITVLYFSLFNSYFVWFAFGNFLLKEYMMIMLIKFYFLSQWTTFCSRVDPHLPIFNKKMISPFGSPMDSAMRWNTDNGTTISFEQ